MKIATPMKGSFIMAFLLVEFIGAFNGPDLQAQQGPIRMAVVKNNFTSFTRKYTNRGKLWIARNKTYLLHPDAHYSDRYSPDNSAVELFEKRTIDSKYFINKDTPSICYAQHSSGPMHFRKNGQWITIDSRLNPKGPLRYEASNQEHPLGFDIKKKSSYIITPDGRTYFNDWKLYGEKGNNETLLASADWTYYTAGDDGISIRNIFPGIDAEMKVSKGSIKTNFIVHANKFSAYEKLLFRDSFSSGRPGLFTFSNGLTGNGLTSPADFRVSAATVFHIKEGVIYQKENPSSTWQFIPYYLDHNKLTLAINRDFLDAQVRNGDVVIDPLVQDVGTLRRNRITGSHSNQNCSLDTACVYDFMVPAPPGATLLNATFSFGFNAFAPCVRQDGAVSFVINNGCASQQWTGTAPGIGEQVFQNQSILLNNGANLADCFPNPVCGPKNIPFSFYFFRSCHGPAGCDGSCITASQNLTITLVGRTFDSASLTASPPKSCAGAPVTLTARGYYGVPPYNFVWQGLPQLNGDSVIQVSPNVSTVYTVQVRSACPGPGNAPITKSINVNVTKPSTPIFTSNSPVCNGGQLILSAPPKPGITYFMANPGAGLGGGQYAGTAVFDNVSGAYAGTWIAVASDTNGCSSDTARTTVIISPTVSPTVTITSSATNICTGDAVSFTATAINAGNSPAYQWLLNNQKAGTNSPVFSSSHLVDNDAVSCIVSATGPCAGAPDVSNIIVVHVSAVTVPAFDAIGPLCQNSTPPPLPPTSKEGIAGIWSPTRINTSVLGTASYIFTPSSAASCSTPASLKIAIVSSVTPTFPTIADSYCQYSTAPVLPLKSKEGITGTWSPSSINTATAGSTTYTFTPTAGQCGTSSQIVLMINPLPTLIMGPDLTIAPGTSTMLNVSVTGNIISYQWMPATGLSSATIEDPVASPSSTTVYTLDVTDDNQCHASDSIRITVSAGGGSSKILVPNAFSPNGDGVNDTWIITGVAAHPGATVDVFNRYGQLVFHSENDKKAWDGTFNGSPLPVGTYYYVIDLKNNEKKMAGSVTIFK